MSQMRPADCRKWVKVLSHEVRYEAKGKFVVGGLSLQVELRDFRQLGIALSVEHFEVTIEHQKSRRHDDQQECQHEILDEECDKLA